MAAFYEFDIKSLDGKPNLLSGMKGKVVLAVNVASECGLTPQYEGLQALYEALADDDFVIVGFPCNQFGAQEPGNADQIRSFCTANYGVTFPLSEKIEVNGPGKHPLYAWLTSEGNGHPGDIQWNFEKFLIGRDGQIVQRYSPRTTPEDEQLHEDLVSALS